jgi:GNAT superfamily N-acetyltransferase
MAIQLLRCTTGEPRFQSLVRELDADLTTRYGEVQSLYTPHNKVAEIETAVLALEGGAPVGCGCWKPHGPGTIELKRMFVRPAARGRRIGQQLVEALEAWARELGHTAAVLETGNLQHEAIALYTRCGYQRTPCFPPYDHLPASVCMRKPL